MKRITKSRQFLEEVCRVREIDGQFFIDGARTGLKPINKWTQATHHKYGKTLVYEYVSIYNYETKKMVLMGYHSFIYAWYKGEVPAGYDVDHIDNDTLNNDIDNLQLLTHEENIKKRGGGKNQYTAAKENGLPKPTYNRKNWNRGVKRAPYEHSEQFLAKQALKREIEEAEKAEAKKFKVQRRLECLEAELKIVNNTPYRYPKAKENAIKRIETEIKNLKEFSVNE